MKPEVRLHDPDAPPTPAQGTIIGDGTNSFQASGLTITLADLTATIEAPEVGVPVSAEDVSVKVPPIDDPSTTIVKDVATSIQVPVQDEQPKVEMVDESLLVGNAVDQAVAQVQGHAVMPVVQQVAPQLDKEDVLGDGLIEVRDAMKEATEVFNRVKSEKIAEQALCSIRNDQQQYEGLAKEIVGKAIKQKERERANRASAAASRAKVMRYQTELESRLNRVEAERNAYRKDLGDLKAAGELDKKETQDLVKQFRKLQGWLRKMEEANGEFVRSIIATGEMDVVFGDKRKILEDDGLEAPEDEEQGEAKKRRL